MVEIHEYFITDADGKRKAVVINIADDQTILEELEKLEVIRAHK